MSIGVTSAGEFVILEPVGAIDHTTVADLMECVSQPPASAAFGFVVDLRGVTSLDLTGLAGLVGLHRHALNQGSELRVAGATPEARQLLERTRLDRVFLILEDRQAALASFA